LRTLHCQRQARQTAKRGAVNGDSFRQVNDHASKVRRIKHALTKRIQSPAHSDANIATEF
jgi:hypothetical protein